MRFIYSILKVITKVALWIYFSETKVKHRARLHFKGPAIVVSNHPNTLMDVLNVAARAREQFHFLANAGLFKSKFGNWFFNTFYCIPIERVLDANGKPINNAANFARANQHLAQGGTLYIAPEGTSWMKRHLHPLKTGTARIAFSAESAHDYQLDLKIIPVGLNYSDPTAFRSQLFIHTGKPLYVRDFQAAYAQDPIGMVREVTQILEEHLRPLMLHTADDAEDERLHRLETMLQNEKPLDLERQFERSKALLEQLQHLQQKEPERYAHLQEAINDYYEKLDKYKLKDIAITKYNITFFWLLLPIHIISAPLFLYGYINHILPAWIPPLIMRYMMRRANLYIGYSSTVKFALGVFLFPLFYWLQSELVAFLCSERLSWWYLLSLPLAGLFTLYYQPIVGRWLARFRGMLHPQTRTLRTQRMHIMQQLPMI